MSSRKQATDFSLGAAVTLAQLAASPYGPIAALRETEPVTWLQAIGGWFVTSRQLAVQVMRDTDTFTVDDPRFTTGAVLGPSMLSFDGAAQSRLRDPFTPGFRPTAVRERLDEFLKAEAQRLVARVAPDGFAELRTSIAAPLAVAAISELLGLSDSSQEEILSWHTNIATAIGSLTAGDQVAPADAAAVHELKRRIERTLGDPTRNSFLAPLVAEGELTRPEIVSSAAVIMFGAIETAEGMTANALFHLLDAPGVHERIRSDRTLLPALIDESLRLEPAATFVDRYATCDTQIGDVRIGAGDLVTVSLLGANRDPAMFDDPDSFNLDRYNARQHVSFVQGPHACIGVHLARLETLRAIEAILDGLPLVALDTATTSAPSGLIFRKPVSVNVTWAAQET